MLGSATVFATHKVNKAHVNTFLLLSRKTISQLMRPAWERVSAKSTTTMLSFISALILFL